MDIIGYNCYLTDASGNRFIGVTQDDLTVNANTKESITKDDTGVKQKVVTSHSISFKVAGVISVDDGYDGKDSDDIIAMAIGAAGRTWNLKYVRANGTTYEGTAILTNYSESSAADPDTEATYTLEFEIISAFTTE